MSASLLSDNAHIWRRAFTRSQLTFTVFALLAIAGCNRAETRVETFPVTGTLSFDGKPPVGATLVFHPTKLEGETVHAAPNARVKDDGSFSVSSYKPGDGAPPGEYAVTVEWYKFTPEGDPGPNVIPAQYATPQKTPIKVTVQKGGPTVVEPIVIKGGEKTAHAGAAPTRK